MKQNVSELSIVVATLEACAEKIFKNEDYSELVDILPEKMIWNLGRIKIGVSEMKEIEESLFSKESFTFLKAKLTFFLDNNNVGYCYFRANLDTPRIKVDKIIIMSNEFEDLLADMSNIFI